MHLNDLFGLERGPENLMKLALYALLVVVVFGSVVDLLSRLSFAQTLVAFLAVILVSPVAYLLRASRHPAPRGSGGRRGAERTPLLPPNEGAE